MKKFFSSPIPADKLSFSIVIGAFTGIMPLWGLTTIICVAVCLVFKLRVLIAVFFNYLFYPLQVLLYYPYFKMGQVLFNPSGEGVVMNIREGFKNNWLEGLQSYADANLLGLAAWLLTSIPIALAIHYLLIHLLHKRTVISDL
jgi:hypothetical protein